MTGGSGRRWRGAECKAVESGASPLLAPLYIRTMTPRFADKVALVTGAGSGMGRAITIRLAEEGASVLALDIDDGRLKETKGMTDGQVSVRQADVGDPQACADAVAATVAEFGRLDVLGNIAGIY